jgi:excisionase family DNA binding protein
MPVATEPDIYTVEEIAEKLRVSPRTVYRMVQRGEIRGLRVGDLYRIPRESFEAFMRGEKPS